MIWRQRLLCISLEVMALVESGGAEQDDVEGCPEEG